MFWGSEAALWLGSACQALGSPMPRAVCQLWISPALSWAFREGNLATVESGPSLPPNGTPMERLGPIQQPQSPTQGPPWDPFQCGFSPRGSEPSWAPVCDAACLGLSLGTCWVQPHVPLGDNDAPGVTVYRALNTHSPPFISPFQSHLFFNRSYGTGSSLAFPVFHPKCTDPVGCPLGVSKQAILVRCPAPPLYPAGPSWYPLHQLLWEWEAQRVRGQWATRAG